MNHEACLDLWMSIQTTYPWPETSVAWADPSVSLRWPDLQHRVGALQTHLASLGLGVGQRVLICLPWSADLLAAWLAVQSVGGIAVLFSPELSNEDIFRWANASEATAEFIDGDLCQRLGKSLQRRTRHQTGILLSSKPVEGWLPWSSLSRPKGEGIAKPELLPSTDALISLTPGTIRAPRGMVFSYRALEDAATRIAGQIERAGLSNQTILFSLPPDITSLTLLLGVWKAGASPAFLPPSEVGSLQGWLEEVRPAAWFTSPFVWHSSPPSALPPSLRQIVLIGEEPEGLKSPLPSASIAVAKGYNLAEVGGILSWGEASAESVGGFPASVEVKIVGRDRRPIRPGSQGAGELLLRGPGLASAVIQAEGHLLGLTDEEGWFATGDLASQTLEGEILLRGRVADLLEEAGERFSCKEVEEILRQHPQILAAAFYRTSGHTPVLKACIEATPDRFGRPLNVYAVTEHLRKQLPHPMLPKLVEFRSPLPRNLYGKLARWRLR